MAEMYGPPAPKKKKAKTSAWTPLTQPTTTQAAIGTANKVAQPQPQVFDPQAALDMRIQQDFNAPDNSLRSERKSQIEDQQVNKVLREENLYMSPEVQRALVSSVQGLPMFEEQAREDEALRALAAESAAAQPVGQVDVSPLMALTDAWTGSNFARSYKAPDNTEGTRMLLDYGTKRAKAMQDRNEAILKAAQAMKMGTATNQLASTLGLSSTAGMGAYRPPSAANSNRGAATDEKFIINQTGKLRKDFQDSNSRLQALEVALQNGDLMSIRRSLALAARELSGEKGVLTEQDVGRILPKTIGMDAAAFEAYILNDPNVQINPQVVAGLLAETKKAGNRTATRYQTAMKAFEDQVRGSVSMGGLPSLNALFKPDAGIIQVPPEQKKENMLDLFKKFQEQKKAGK